jgi:hypothetical protein
LSGFYLVQRLQAKRAPHSPAKGFDGYFSLDYMGSSEFEWGAIPKALKAMRERPVVVEPQTVSIDGLDWDIHFVGHEGVSAAGEAMEAWAGGSERRRPFYGKEWPQFHEVLTGQQSDYVRTNAWWDIENNVAWAIDPAVADLLRSAFNARRHTDHTNGDRDD